MAGRIGRTETGGPRWHFYSDDRRIGRHEGGRRTIIPLARGHVLSRARPRLIERGRTLIGIDDATLRAAILFPAYERTLTRRGERFRLWAAVTEADLAAGNALLNAVHLHKQPRTGMMICLRSLDRPPPGGAVDGVAVVGEIYHTMMQERDPMAAPVFGADWYARHRAGALARSDVVRTLGLTGGLRFAIRAARQGGGLGTLLGKAAGDVAACHRWPPADFLEVVRWMPEREFAGICAGKRGDFLAGSRYVPVPLFRWREKGETPDDILDAEPARNGPVPGYYWQGLRDRRLANRSLAAVLAGP